MKLKTISPPIPIRKYVQSFWVAEGETHSFTAIADGCPGMIFSITEGGMFQYEKKLSPIFLYGQTIRLTELKALGKFQLIGLSFYPHMIKSLFGMNARELTDSCLDLRLLPPKERINLTQLINTSSSCQQIEIISDYLHSLADRKNNLHADGSVEAALSHIVKSNGDVSLKELRQKLRLTERTFERRFEQYVGISPKLFSRICRFQASLNQLKNKKHSRLSDIAFDNGYTDQSHFIRSFKEFAGHTPNKFQKVYEEAEGNIPVFTH